MPLRFHFTTRDWIWFCIVFTLAIGWGGHYRYSQWLEDNFIANPPKYIIYDEDLMREMKSSREDSQQLAEFAEELTYAIRKMHNEEQRNELNRLRDEYRKSKGLPLRSREP